MRIAILQTDEVEPAFQPRFGNLAGMMQSMLSTTHAEAFDVQAFKVHEGEEPADLDLFDGYLLTGSRKGVYDADAWIQRLLGLIRSIHAAELKLVGICFGHQAIAEALGGVVRKSAKGWGVGVHAYAVEDGFDTGRHRIGEHVALPCCHQDQVIELPPGARRILTNEFCENAGFVVGDHTLAMQPHPEFSTSYLECILRTLEDRLDGKFADAMESLKRNTDNAKVARYIASFYRDAS